LSSTEQVALGFDMQVNEKFADGFINMIPLATGANRFYSFTSTKSVAAFAKNPRLGYALAKQDSAPMKWKDLKSEKTIGSGHDWSYSSVASRSLFGEKNRKLTWGSTHDSTVCFFGLESVGLMGCIKPTKTKLGYYNKRYYAGNSLAFNLTTMPCENWFLNKSMKNKPKCSRNITSWKKIKAPKGPSVLGGVKVAPVVKGNASPLIAVTGDKSGKGVMNADAMKKIVAADKIVIAAAGKIVTTIDLLQARKTAIAEADKVLADAAKALANAEKNQKAIDDALKGPLDAAKALPDAAKALPDAAKAKADAAKALEDAAKKNLIPDVGNPISPQSDKVIVDAKVDDITINMGNLKISKVETLQVREARIAYVKALRSHKLLLE